MRRSYEGGTEVHPGAGIPGRQVTTEWTRPGPSPMVVHRVSWGTCDAGWWAQSSASIGDWPWVFTDEADARRAVGEMLAEYSAEEWTRMPVSGARPTSGGAGATG